MGHDTGKNNIVKLIALKRQYSPFVFLLFLSFDKCLNSVATQKQDTLNMMTFSNIESLNSSYFGSLSKSKSSQFNADKYMILSILRSFIQSSF